MRCAIKGSTLGGQYFGKKGEEKFGGVENFWLTLLKGRFGEEECCLTKMMLLLRRAVFFPLCLMNDFTAWWGYIWECRVFEAGRRKMLT
jgi:hypothetical protein